MHAYVPHYVKYQRALAKIYHKKHILFTVFKLKPIVRLIKYH